MSKGHWNKTPGTWPQYSKACIKDMTALLTRGGSLSAYKANPKVGVGPTKGSWAWHLEREIEEQFKVKHAVVCNSGTAALHMALSTLNLQPGDEVITSPYTFSATVSAIIMAGGTPVFADVDRDTFVVNSNAIDAVRTKRTKAVLPVHLFGRFASYGSFGLPIIEDACQAVGAWHTVDLNQSVAACFSFNGSKNVPCGEGGAMVTNDSATAEKARLLMNHGENFQDQAIGYNYRMNEQTALIAWHGLKDLDKRNAWRSELVKIAFPEIWEPNHAYYVLGFTVDSDRDKFIKSCANRGLEVGAGYIQPTLDRYRAFAKYARGPLPNVRELSEKRLCIISTLRWPAPKAYARWVRKVVQEAKCEAM